MPDPKPEAAPDPHAVPLADRPPCPDSFPVTVLMQCTQVTGHPWLDERWELIGVLPTPPGGTAADTPALRDDATGNRIVRHDGLTLRLHADEADSYYHNLMVPNPLCFVVSELDARGVPRPMLVTASFDEANAHVEGDDRVDSLPLPPTLYQAIERYVLTHYVPTQRAKRKRDDWNRP